MNVYAISVNTYAGNTQMQSQAALFEATLMPCPFAVLIFAVQLKQPTFVWIALKEFAQLN